MPLRRELEGSYSAHRGPDRILYNINRPCEPPPRSCELTTESTVHRSG